MRKRGGRIAHLDITIICEAPRIGPHRDAMRARIAAVAGVTIDRVAVKATTNEELGSITVSIGLAELKSKEAGHDLVERADAALYASKRTGRNRLTNAGKTMVEAA